MGIHTAGGGNNLVLGLLNQPRPSARTSTVSWKCAAPAESRAGYGDANNADSTAGWRTPWKTFSVFISEQFSCSEACGVHTLKRKECRLQWLKLKDGIGSCEISLHSFFYLRLKECI